MSVRSLAFGRSVIYSASNEWWKIAFLPILALAGVVLLLDARSAPAGESWERQRYGVPSRLLPWTQSGYRGYNESHRPAQGPPPTVNAAPQKYTIAITLLPHKPQGVDAKIGVLMAHLPEGARIWFNDQPSRSRERVRYFATPLLEPGKRYYYTARVVWHENGRWVSKTEKVPIRVGQMYCIYLTLADDKDVIERFPIKHDSSWIPLPVEIKGKRYHFILDTGATHTFYDKSIWHLLGKPITVKKTGPKEDSVATPFFDPPDARLGKLTLPKDYWALGVDQKEHHEESGEEFHGILGMDFLKEQIFRIDFDRGEVVFLRSVGPAPGQRLDIRLTKHQPQVKVDLPGLKEPEWFLLDTGTARELGEDGGCIRQAAFEALIQSGKLTSVQKAEIVRDVGRKMVRIGWLDSFPFAGNIHKSLIFHEERISILGLDLLSRYIVTFDFPHQAIYLKKGRQFDRPIRYDRSGLDMRRVKGETVVVSVTDGSAAAKAGIRLGDVLLQIDKEQISGMTLFTLRDRLCEEGKKICLTVRRGEERLEVPVVLSEEDKDEKKEAGKEKKKKATSDQVDRGHFTQLLVK